MQYLCAIEGDGFPKSGDGREMVIRHLSSDAELGSESVVIVSENIKLKLADGAIGRRYDIYVDNGKKITIDGCGKIITGGLVGSRSVSVADDVIFSVQGSCYIDCLFDGKVWRIRGIIYR